MKLLLGMLVLVLVDFYFLVVFDPWGIKPWEDLRFLQGLLVAIPSIYPFHTL
jgi:hypothetical protein